MFDIFADENIKIVDKLRRIDNATLLKLLVEKGIFTLNEYSEVRKIITKAIEENEIEKQEKAKKEYEDWKNNLDKK